MSSDTPRATDHREAVALFRHGVIGSLLGRDFDHGQLRAELRVLADKRWRPPGSDRTRRYGISTIERWYYAYRAEGLDGLKPGRRSDAGRARALPDDKRQLLLDIRREYPSASGPLILRTLVTRGVLAPGQISAATLNRLYVEHGLRRAPRKAPPGEVRRRLRWAVERPGMLWHADVCHGPKLAGTDQRVRVHGILDDHARYGVALEAYEREREQEMLESLGHAVIRHGRPEGLYVDNGPTYAGEALATVCGRLGIGLHHARPYDPQARGKMERFWRTLREQCLDYIPDGATIHDVRVRIHAWLDTHYHKAPHAGLLGASPEAAYFGQERVNVEVPHDDLAAAFAVRARRKIRGDGTLDIDGVTYELDASYLAGKTVTLVTHLPPIDRDCEPYVEHDGHRLAISKVDPAANARRARTPIPERRPPQQPTGFDPAQTHLDIAAGRLRPQEDNA